MKLNYKKTIYVGLAFFSISLFWQFYYAFMPLTLTQVFGLDDLWRGIVMSIDNFVALIMLPLFGYLSDKTKDKGHGKRTPYILIGTFLSIVLFMGMGVLEHAQLQGLLESGVIENASAGMTAEEIAALSVRNQSAAYGFMSENPAALTGFIVLLVMTLLAMGIYRTPAVALMPDVTPKPLRSQANAVINIMGGAGGLIATVLFTFTVKDYKSRLISYGAVAAIMLIAIILFYVLVKEPELVKDREAKELSEGLTEAPRAAGEKMDPSVKRSLIFLLASIALWFLGYYSIYSSFTIYANQELGIADGRSGIFFIIAMAVSAVAFIPIAFFSSKAGRKKTVMGGIVLMSAAIGFGSVVTSGNIWPMYVLFPLVGAGWASINVNSLPMVVEMAKPQEVGRFTGIYYAASMSAQGLAPIVSGYLMTVFGRRILFPLGAVLVAAAFITMIFVRHGDAKKL